LKWCLLSIWLIILNLGEEFYNYPI
jgi:hypothetical protein